jgi:hypothetical protein
MRSKFIIIIILVTQNSFTHPYMQCLKRTNLLKEDISYLVAKNKDLINRNIELVRILKQNGYDFKDDKDKYYTEKVKKDKAIKKFRIELSNKK